ncbi:MAG: PorT family protein [Bacteroidales bacterium]|nr:PorT family protein [Bacteroidales bacterium]
MKKRIALYFVLILISVSAFSQETGYRFGIFADPVISWLNPDVSSVDSKGNRLGFNIGLSVDKFFAKNYAFSSGLSIHNAGGSLLFKPATTIRTNQGNISLPENTKVTYKLQYLHVPIGMKLLTNEIGYSTFYGQLGLNAMVNIKATGVSNSGNLDNENIGKEINLINLGYHIGGGIEYSIGGNTRLTAGLVYMNGFTDVTSRGADKVVLQNILIKTGRLFLTKVLMEQLQVYKTKPIANPTYPY